MGIFILIGFVILMECLVLFITSRVNAKRLQKDPYLQLLNKLVYLTADISSYFNELHEDGDPVVHELVEIHDLLEQMKKDS